MQYFLQTLLRLIYAHLTNISCRPGSLAAFFAEGHRSAKSMYGLNGVTTLSDHRPLQKPTSVSNTKHPEITTTSLGKYFRKRSRGRLQTTLLESFAEPIAITAG